MRGRCKLADAHPVFEPPEDFEGLRQYIEEPRTALTGLGDGACMFNDNGDGRFKIDVLEAFRLFPCALPQRPLHS